LETENATFEKIIRFLMKNRALALILFVVLASGFASCRQHKDSCAAYQHIEMKGQK
jgi:hypothetical protein